MRAGARVPLLEWLLEYRKEWLRHDVVAGLTTAAVVIPKAMAYATVAGLPIQAGLYTALVPSIAYAVLGTSRPLSVTTTTTLAILTGAELGEVVPDGQAASVLQATAVLTMMVGVMLIAASLLRLGFVANFISDPVLVGFKAGIAVVIILDQIPKILGMLAKEFPLEEFRRTEQQGAELAGSPLRRTAGTQSPPGRLHRLHTEGARSVRADGQAVAGARRWPR